MGEYERRLRDNALNVPNLNNYLSKAVAALMLCGYGAGSNYALAVVLKGDRFYAEAKRFNRKTQPDLRGA